MVDQLQQSYKTATRQFLPEYILKITCEKAKLDKILNYIIVEEEVEEHSSAETKLYNIYLKAKVRSSSEVCIGSTQVDLSIDRSILIYFKVLTKQ